MNAIFGTPLGGAYCNDELGKWKIAHSYFAFRAIEHLGRDAFWGERWQQLESITQLMLTSGVKVLGNKSELSVTAAQKTIQQNEIGEIPEIPDWSASLLVLARNHNVIDSILYDCRRKSRKVYFIQTSSSAYWSK